MEKIRKLQKTRNKPDKIFTESYEQKALTKVGAFCFGCITTKNQNLFNVLNQNLQLKKRKDITIKHPSENMHQINNTEWWYQNDQFGGSILLPCYKFLLFFVQSLVKYC